MHASRARAVHSTVPYSMLEGLFGAVKSVWSGITNLFFSALEIMVQTIVVVFIVQLYKIVDIQ